MAKNLLCHLRASMARLCQSEFLEEKLKEVQCCVE